MVCKMDNEKEVRAVKVIPATIDPKTRMKKGTDRKRRVAGYGRVSTDKDEQFTSFEAQVDYYTEYIQKNPSWEFVKVYSDDGITGTKTKGRDGFNEMIADALDGKIDLIITKSISRFARNTVDSLITIRKLKEVGCECYFEKENIYTFDSKGELFLTIMASMAQEESRSISENIKWGIQKKFAAGRVSLGYSTFLGYQKGKDRNHPLEIIPEEAHIIRRIYSEFISGYSAFLIAKGLTRDGIPTPAGKEEWHGTTVVSILKNEKYKGSALLQKSFVVDYLSKVSKKNEGELPQYYVDESHQGIIGKQEWELVQQEIKRRKSINGKYCGIFIFCSRLICGDCGAFYGAKVWDSTNKYRRTVWQCNRKYGNTTTCSTPHLVESEIKERFLHVFHKKYCPGKQLTTDAHLMIKILANQQQIQSEINMVKGELATLKILITASEDKCMLNSDNKKLYRGYLQRDDELSKKLECLIKEKHQNKCKRQAMRKVINEILIRDEPIQYFDDKLWIAAIEYVIVEPCGNMKFIFRDGEVLDG